MKRKIKIKIETKFKKPSKEEPRANNSLAYLEALEGVFDSVMNKNKIEKEARERAWSDELRRVQMMEGAQEVMKEDRRRKTDSICLSGFYNFKSSAHS